MLLHRHLDMLYPLGNLPRLMDFAKASTHPTRYYARHVEYCYIKPSQAWPGQPRRRLAALLVFIAMWVPGFFPQELGGARLSSGGASGER